MTGARDGQKMKTLNFECRGQWYKVNGLGHMTQANNQEFSGQWRFLGVSKQSNRVTVPFSVNTPAEEFIEGLVWDIDHGTTRQWGGKFNGKLPRVTMAYWEE